MLIHDDVLATGGTAKATVELVEQLGGEVVGLPFIIELEFLNGRERLEGYDVYSLIQVIDDSSVFVRLRIGSTVAGCTTS